MEDAPIPASVAIVGVGCRLPGGAHSPKELWELLMQSTSTWSHVPEDRFMETSFLHPDPNDPNGSHNHLGGHFLTQNVRTFDHGVFNITPQEASAMDPQQRILLEVVYEALENAGMAQAAIRGSQTSVHVAAFTRDYDRNLYKDTLDIPQYQATGTGDAILANRISYVFDLRGPSMTIDTGCSGGLVAIHQACQSLSSGESNMAIVGAANLILSPDQQVGMSNLHMLNADGRSWPFDQRGAGYGRGEGFVAFVLKRADGARRDGDYVHGIIRGSGVNQDGRTIAGITAPNGAAQAELQRRLYDKLHIDPLDVSYVEAHGTGTVSGDKEEIEALTKVFCKDRQSPLCVGSIKSNIGHIECASGLAGLLKSVLILQNQCIPPSIGFSEEKAGLQLQSRSIYVPTSVQEWPKYAKLIASVNSFGYGGTNAHVVLGSSKIDRILPRTSSATNNRPLPRLFFLSAQTQDSLQRTVQRHHNWLLEKQGDVDLSSLSHTLSNRRTHHQWRYGCVANGVPELVHHLSCASNADFTSIDRKKLSINFIFTGQGAQWPGMGRELLLQGQSLFAKSIHKSRDTLFSFGASWDLMHELIHYDGSRIHLAEVAQPATTAIQIALIDLLDAMDVRPDTVIGHSSGEIAAAYAAKLISQSTALRLAYNRGLLPGILQEKSHPKGGMLAVGLGEQDIRAFLERITKGTVTIACINSSLSTTVSGDLDGIEELEQILKIADVFYRRLHVDVAYHSKYMQAVSHDYKARIGSIGIETTPSGILFYSTVSGKPKSSGFDADYWVENLVSKVHFKDGLDKLCHERKSYHQVFFEIGPHNTLSGPARQCVSDLSSPLQYDYIAPFRRGVDARRSLLEAVCKWFKCGKTFSSFGPNILDPESESVNLIHDLPTYSWNHSKTHWHESRLSRDHRLRKHPYHDLTGIKSAEATSFEPRWRHLISRTTLPWLTDHVVDEMTVFPASGYMCMAIEAIRQFAEDTNPGRSIEAVVLRDVEFLKALIIPESPERTEIQLSFSPVDTIESLHFNFRISSFKRQNHTWEQHCLGSVEIDYQGENKGHPILSSIDESQISWEITGASIYDQLRKTGNAYGPSFMGIKSMRMGKNHATASIVVPNVAELMPAKHLKPHIIHPTTLDTVLHSSLPLAALSLEGGSVMPIRINELVISTAIRNEPGIVLEVQSQMMSSSKRVSTMDLNIRSNRDNALALSISGLRVNAVAPSALAVEAQRDICWNLLWNQDADFVNAGNFDQNQIGDETSSGIICTLNDATSYYVMRSLALMQQEQLSPLPKYSRLIGWMGRQVEHNTNGHQHNIRVGAPNLLVEAEQSDSANMKMLSKMGPCLTQILSGTVDPLEVLLEGGLLYKVYQDKSFSPSYDQMSQYAKHISFKNPRPRILEIGAGTGGATVPFLRAMRDVGAFPEIYDFTDVSSGFFESAASLLSEFNSNINFRKLDIEVDPLSQGFERFSYDIVLAFNCLHATSSIENTLKNVRSLLRHDGRLILLELVNPQPFHHITIGTLPGYWKGSTDGRSDGPFLTEDNWRQTLGKVSIEIQFSIKDSESQHLHSLMVGRPHQIKPDSRTPMVSVTSVSQTGSNFISKLVASLEDTGIKATAPDIDLAFEDDNIKIIIDDGERPLLTDISETRFRRLCTMLRRSSRVIWISGNENVASSADPERYLITGLARTAHAENDDLCFVTIDIQESIANPSNELLQFLGKCLHQSFYESRTSIEREYVFRKGVVSIPRLLPSQQVNDWVSKSALPLRPQFNHLLNSGDKRNTNEIAKANGVPALNGLEEPKGYAVNGNAAIIERREPPSGDEVELQVKAISLPKLGKTQGLVGYGGVVSFTGPEVRDLAVGDRVMAFGIHSESDTVHVRADQAVAIPREIPFTTAAVLPMPTMTAYYILSRLMDIGPSIKVMVLGSESLVFETTVLSSKHMGAEVLVYAADASQELSIQKRSHLNFASIVRGHGRGKFTGLQLHETLDAIVICEHEELPSFIIDSLKPFGSIAHVGGHDTNGTELNYRSRLPPNVTLHTFDIDSLISHQPQQARKLLRNVGEVLSADPALFSTLSHAIHPVERIQDIGTASKLENSKDKAAVFEITSGSDLPNSAVLEPNFKLSPEATFIIAGGQGYLGRKYVSLLMDHGAQYIVTLSRSQHSGKEGSPTYVGDTLHGKHSTIHHIQCDISKEEQVVAVAKNLETMGLPPVKGVIQSAMVLQDRSLDFMSVEDFKMPLQSKVKGTLNLQKTFASHDLEFFIMLSSAACIAGTLGQGNYNAGNAVQDALAQTCSTSGCHYMTICPGLIEGATLYGDNDAVITFLNQAGFTGIRSKEMESILRYSISPNARRDRLPVIAAGFDSESLSKAISSNGNIRSPMFAHALRSTVIQATIEDEKKEKDFKQILKSNNNEEIETYILKAVVTKLANLVFAEVETMDLSKSLYDFGLDSLIAIELKSWIKREFEASIQSLEILNEANICTLAKKIYQRSKLVLGS